MKVLFFAPHAALWVHAFPEALVAEALQQAGHEVAYVGCGRALAQFCVPMAAAGMLPTTDAARRARVCAGCDGNDRMLRKGMDLQGPRLADVLTPAQLQEAGAQVAALGRDQLVDFSRQGIALGRMALYQLMIRHKRLDLDFSDTEWDQYRVEVLNTLLTYLACRRIFEEQKPQRLVVYNALYPVTRVACLLAQQMGIPHYFLHAGGNLAHRLQTLLIGRGDTFSFMPHLVSQWPRFADIPCSPHLLASVAEHYLELLRGRSVFVYSSQKSGEALDVRARFGIAPGQRLLVAAAGSYDEEVAAEMIGARKHPKPPLFPTQIEWIRALLKHVGERPDLFLVIRVHPREFPNRRDATLSQHATLLKAVLQDLPSNAAVNWPGDNLSLYDLFTQTDVFLTSWSSAGKEASLLGIPTVLYSSDLVFYPADLGYLGTTLEAYFAAIDQALAAGWSAQRARRAWRWAALEFGRAAAFIGDAYPMLEHPRRSLGQRIVRRLWRAIDPAHVQRRDLARRGPGPGSSGRMVALIAGEYNSLLELPDAQQLEHSDLETETIALRQECRRIADALFPDPRTRRGSALYTRLTQFQDRSSHGR